MTATELKRHVLDLPTEEKLDLVEALWQSLEDEAAAIPLHAWQEKLWLSGSRKPSAIPRFGFQRKRCLGRQLKRFTAGAEHDALVPRRST